jgi:hypothetical protein
MSNFCHFIDYWSVIAIWPGDLSGKIIGRAIGNVPALGDHSVRKLFTGFIRAALID